MNTFSPDSQYLFDPIRCKRVSALPEENVRQTLLSFLTQELAYPPKQIIVEKGIKSFLSTSQHPFSKKIRGRADILVISPSSYFPPGEKPFCFSSPKPLLLIECKAKTITSRSFNQLISYNYFIGAPCLSLISQTSQLTGFLSPKTKTFAFFQGIPSYSQLMNFYIDAFSCKSPCPESF
ncbi:type I restriction enzyme HsdR N-terminal domain-containing protein [Chlamydia sp.]|uniref:type I restriction enzyme HsdR N-terminal domain-containing protein n=1 Tax=Chlamydia sp. TaxID=35827 RepID=UPI0025B957C5|nr:type I restriction enzyme HsdR N-terminal domain-containing protein [Chlamydia sp.]MBQ8498631.1 type I restriction enzyme HsdR N-terminal domain-containing protein [Chlamydia sp.]